MTGFGDYEVVRPLASGGMAQVYLARQRGAEVALKVLCDARADDADARAQFLDEARVVGMLDHPNVARVHQVATRDDGVPYLAMEYVDGADLRALVIAAEQRQQALPYECVATIVAQAAAGLDHAHRRCGPDGRPLKLVHRDVSLSNIMVTRGGHVKIIDFGIASFSASLHPPAPGTVRGKASYMAPEQCLDAPVDLRADVFALGIVLYELVTGRRCFQGATDVDRMLAVVRGDFVPARFVVPTLPRSFEQVIATALAHQPQDRYPSAAALREALEGAAAEHGWALGPPTTRRFMEQLFGAGRPSAPADDDAVTRGRPSVSRLSYNPLAAA